MIGAANAPRYGMLAALLTTLALSGNPKDTQFVVVDRCIPSTQWSDVLRNVCDSLLRPAGFSTFFTDATNTVDAVLDDLLVELTQRQKLSEDKLIACPSVFAMMTELERIDSLRRKSDTYGLTDSLSGEKLRRLLVEGPTVGIHLLLSFSGVRALTYVMDERSGLINFRHRVALQMSEDESFTLMRGRKAAQLQVEGPIPVCALYLDMESDKTIRFKPYSIDKGTAQDSIVEQVQRIGKILTQRRVTA